jgi:hypothetical protein
MFKRLEQDLKNHYLHRRFNVDKVYFADISDIHLGHKGFDEEAFSQFIELVKRTPDFYLFLGGDSINHANKGSKSSQFEEDMTPREQIKGKFVDGKLVKKGLVQHLEPVKHRIIGKIDGNHDGTRSQEFNDISPMEWLCDTLNIRYFGDLAILQFVVGGNAYTHYIHHISGSTGNNLNLAKLQKKGEEFRCDVIWGEHTHRRHYGSEIYVDVDLYNKKPIVREQYFVNAGTFLNWSGYAKTKGYRINKPSCNIVELSGVKGKWGIKVHELQNFM